MLGRGDLGHRHGVATFYFAPFRGQESVTQPLHYLALAGGLGEAAPGFEESVRGAPEPLLGRHDAALGGGDGEHGALELAGLGGAVLQVREPALLFARPSLSGLDRRDCPTVGVERVAELDSGGLLGHLAEAEDYAEAEAVAHRLTSPRNMGGIWDAGPAGTA